MKLQLVKKLLMLGIVALISLLVISGCGSSKQGSTNNKQGTSGQSTQSKAAIDYPKKPVTLLVWSAAGSPVDIMARQISKIGEKYFGQSITVENKTGGDGAVAMQQLLANPADGYTLCANTRSMVVSLATSLKNTFKAEQFTYVAKIQDDPYLLAVRAESPYKTIDDIIKAAKASPENLSIAGYGADSAQSLITDEWAKQAGIKIKWLPYSGGSEAVVAVLGGHADAVMTNISGVVEQIRAKKLRVLAISTDKRHELLPDIPTFKELGYKDMVQSHWRGIMVKAGTPDAVLQKLSDVLKKVATDPDFVNYMKTGGLSTPEQVTYTQFTEEVKQDVKKMEQAFSKK